MFRATKRILTNVKNNVTCLITPERKKESFLQKKMFNYYYEVFINDEYKKREFSLINIPVFLLDNQVKDMAMKRAKADLEEVIANGQLNKWFKKAL